MDEWIFESKTDGDTLDMVNFPLREKYVVTTNNYSSFEWRGWTTKLELEKLLRNSYDRPFEFVPPGFSQVEIEQEQLNDLFGLYKDSYKNNDHMFDG